MTEEEVKKTVEEEATAVAVSDAPSPSKMEVVVEDKKDDDVVVAAVVDEETAKTKIPDDVDDNKVATATSTTEEAVVVKPDTTGTSTTTTTVEAMNMDPIVVDKVKERLEFFFSDANVRQDVFIRKLLMYSDTKSVPVDVLLRFNTIKKLSMDPATVIHAATLLPDTLIVDAEKLTIRRTVPFTKEFMDGNIPKSLHITNVPMTDDKKRYAAKVVELLDIFNKYGKVAVCKLKYTSYDPTAAENNHNDRNTNNHYGGRPKKRFFPIGTALIEYATEDELKKAAEATVTMKGIDNEKLVPSDTVTLPVTDTRTAEIVLGVQTLADHIAKCKNEREKRKEKEALEETADGSKKRKDRPDNNDDAPAEADKDGEKKNEDTSTTSKKDIQYKYDWKPKCVIQLKGLPEACDREAMLTAIAQCGLEKIRTVDDVKERNIYVDYSRGQTDGAIRFPEPHDTDVEKLAQALKDGTLTILDAKIDDATILDGEAEQQYWTKFIAFKTRQMIQRDEERRGNNNSRGGRHGGRGGGGRGYGRGGGGRGRGGGRGHKKQRRDR